MQTCNEEQRRKFMMRSHLWFLRHAVKLSRNAITRTLLGSDFIPRKLWRKAAEVLKTTENPLEIIYDILSSARADSSKRKDQKIRFRMGRRDDDDDRPERDYKNFQVSLHNEKSFVHDEEEEEEKPRICVWWCINFLFIADEPWGAQLISTGARACVGESSLDSSSFLWLFVSIARWNFRH